MNGPRPLAGFTVGITAGRKVEEQAAMLESRGAAVVRGPAVSTTNGGEDELLRAHTEALIAEPPDFLVANTGYGMRRWLDAAAGWGVADLLLHALDRTVVLARGAKASSVAQNAGLMVQARAEHESVEEVVEMLVKRGVAGTRVAFQLHGTEGHDARARLTEAGAVVIELPTYRMTMPDDTGPAASLAEAACNGRLAALTFTSAPAVHNFFVIAEVAGLGMHLLDACNATVVVACVGPVCAEATREHGVADPVYPQVGRLGLMVKALVERLAPGTPGAQERG